LLQFGYCGFNERSGTPVLLSATDVYYEVLQQQSSVFAVEHFRMELYAPELFVLCLVSGDGYFVGRSDDFKVVGDGSDGVTVAHPYLRMFADAFQQRVLVVESSQVCTSVFAGVGRLYLSSVGVRHELCTIADTQDRIFSADVG